MARAGRSALPAIALAAALVFVGELAFTAPPGLGSAQRVRTARGPDGGPVGTASRRAGDRAVAARRPVNRTQRNRSIGRSMLHRRRWSSARQFRCLDLLWTRESHWNQRAAEPSTGAYGIPQAHPGARMAGAGRDWRSNPRTQIRWGLRYVRGRHGGACAAWYHFRARGWY